MGWADRAMKASIFGSGERTSNVLYVDGNSLAFKDLLYIQALTVTGLDFSDTIAVINTARTIAIICPSTSQEHAVDCSDLLFHTRVGRGSPPRSQHKLQLKKGFCHNKTPRLTLCGKCPIFYQ